MPGDPALDHMALTDVKPLTPIAAAIDAARAPSPGKPAEAIEAPAAQRRDAAPPAIPNAAADCRSSGRRCPAGRCGCRPTTSGGVAQQFAPLPRHERQRRRRTVRRSLIAPRRLPLRTKPSSRIATKVDGPASGSARPTPARGSAARRQAAAAAMAASGSAGSLAGGHSRRGIARQRGARRLSPSRGARIGPTSRKAAAARPRPRPPSRPPSNGSPTTRTPTAAGIREPTAAGKETNVLGRDRQNAGSNADSAMTGLALLAFLASGHTHLEGPYRDDVRRGLEYLMRTQAADGNLAGQAAPYEFMYCHAMAACALSEAYGMTHDARLREPVRRAVGYTLRAQDPIGGGWRYRPGDAGDTSQLGWQLMVLKSAELAGIPIPDNTRQGIIRYLAERFVGHVRRPGLVSARRASQANHDRRSLGLLAVSRAAASKSRPATKPATSCWPNCRARATRISIIGTMRLLACTSCRATTGSAGTTPCARRWSVAK